MKNRSIESMVLVGHPYAPIGVGENIRCSFRAFRSVALRPKVFDIWRYIQPEPELYEEFAPFISNDLGRINVFHINGDEVQQTLEHVAEKHRANSYNIIYPMWELSNYPECWGRQLERFDEVWVPSQFTFDAIAKLTQLPVVHMPLACEVILSSFLGRRYFGIPESSYVFLFFFDFRSYAARKNPNAVLDAFRLLLSMRPTADVCLVIKLNSARPSPEPEEVQMLKAQLAEWHDRVVLIDCTMSDNEIKNLVRCCDCFVSLHRSEGFGRGPAEAMYLEKPVIATGYSGNMDFMSEDNALLVQYTLVDVAPGAYPHWEGQVWAEPDVEQAAWHMLQLIDNPKLGLMLGRKASLDLRINFGYRAAGNRYRKRIEAIIEQTA